MSQDNSNPAQISEIDGWIDETLRYIMLASPGRERDMKKADEREAEIIDAITVVLERKGVNLGPEEIVQVIQAVEKEFLKTEEGVKESTPDGEKARIAAERAAGFKSGERSRQRIIRAGTRGRDLHSLSAGPDRK